MTVKIKKSGTSVVASIDGNATNTVTFLDNGTVVTGTTLTANRVHTLNDTSTTLTEMKATIPFRVLIARFYTTAATNTTISVPVCPSSAISGVTAKTSGYADAGVVTAIKNIPFKYTKVLCSIMTSNVNTTAERTNFINGVALTSGYTDSSKAPTLVCNGTDIKATTMTTTPRVVCASTPTTTTTPLSLTVVTGAGTTYIDIVGEIQYV